MGSIFYGSQFNGDIPQWILHEDLVLRHAFWGSIYLGTVKQTEEEGITMHTLKHGIKQPLEIYAEFYSNGNKSFESELIGAEKNGISAWYFESGQKKSQSGFINDKLDGLTQWWHEDGSKHIEVNWRNGKRHGSKTIWDIKGNIIFTATFHRDESTDQNGLDPQYDENNNLTHHIEYKNGYITDPNVPISDFTEDKVF